MDDGHTLEGRTLRSSVMDEREAFWWLEKLPQDCIRRKVHFRLDDGTPLGLIDPFEQDGEMYLTFNTRTKGTI